MGNKQSNQGNNVSSEFLLTKEEFIDLRVNDKIDHRDYEGRYIPAQIVCKSGLKVTIHYIGWSNKWDKTVNYKSRPTDFARFGSVSSRKSTGSLSNYKIGDYVFYRPVAEQSCKWRKGRICKMDNKYGSGQVKVQYTNSSGKTHERWTHLDNSLEILPARNDQNKKYQSSQHSHVNRHSHYNNYNNYNHDNNNNNNNNQMQYQQYKQVQVKRQDQMTVRTQLLLDDTEQQCIMIRDYIDGINSGKCSKDEIKEFNQKVVCGLTLFDMKVDGMRKNSKSENLNFNDAFKSSAMIVKKFENECKSQFGHNKYLMNRLEPCLNYMKAVLYGHDVPQLPYINDYKFNQEIASNVISDVAHAQNHVMPERIKHISQNNEKFKMNQYKLKKEYESGDYNDNDNDKVHVVDYTNLIQDYNTDNYTFGKSKKEQDQIIEEQMNEYRYQKPDLVNGGGMDWE